MCSLIAGVNSLQVFIKLGLLSTSKRVVYTINGHLSTVIRD